MWMKATAIAMVVAACGSKESSAPTPTATNDATPSAPPLPAPDAAPAPRPIETPVEVTARQLFADYQANEISADEKYLGKLLLVTGRVTRISKVLGDPVVELGTSNEFMPVYAGFASEAEAGSLKRGQQIAARCRGKGASLAHPRVGSCVLVPGEPAKVAPKIAPSPQDRERVAKNLKARVKDRADFKVQGLVLVLSTNDGTECATLIDAVIESHLPALRSAGFDQVKCDGGSSTAYVR